MSGKGTTAIAVIALLLGTTALGFMIYNIYFIEEDPSGIWYAEYEYSYDSPSDGVTYKNLTFLMISFRVNPGESALFSYTGVVRFDDSVGETWMEVYFNLDGNIITTIRSRIAGDTNGTDWWYIPVSLQYSDSLELGAHNVTIALRGISSLNSIRYNTLVVQTYRPQS